MEKEAKPVNILATYLRINRGVTFKKLKVY